MKNYDATRQRLREKGWSRSDRTVNKNHRELWHGPDIVNNPILDYHHACRAAGITPNPQVWPTHQTRGPSPRRDKSLQAKHIDPKLLLETIDRLGGAWARQFKTNSRWANRWEIAETEFPKTPPKVLFAALKALKRRGFISGCVCGCRGDFEVLDKGYEFIAQGRP